MYYPELAPVFGVLAGAAFTVSFATFGIFGGVIADKCNRALVIGCACLLWSACTILTGAIPNFYLLFVFRFLTGIFQSVFNPCAYTIIADLFHPDYRTTANSFFNSGIYLGGGLASIGTLLIANAGWRWAYIIIGCIGGGFGVI